MKSFYQVLVNTLISTVTNNFVWFALVFWAYLETQSVLTTSVISGVYLTATALSGIWFGSIVDHNKKKDSMILSTVFSSLFFISGLLVLYLFPSSAFREFSSWTLWLLIGLLLLGVIVGNIRNIVIPTVVTLMVEEDRRDKANGLVGSMTGVAFAITSVASGLAVAYTGMFGVMWIAVISSLLVLLHLFFVEIVEPEIVDIRDLSTDATSLPVSKIDLKGTVAAILAVPGLLALIFFATFNNLLGGVFMSLMDAYGLTLVSVQVWGLLFGFLSFGFILGGVIIAKYGLGKNPVRTLFFANIVMWIVAIFFTVQASILLLAVGMLVWISLSPFIEAAEHTIIQKVVPLERQGRVFGFAQSIEQAASPVTSFIIGPIAQFIFIPFMTTGAGVELIGDWYGVGPGRGMALVFSAAGIVGLIATILAIRSNAYLRLSQIFK